MSNIKEEAKEFDKKSVNKDKFYDQNNKSVSQAKELIKKLLQNTLNIPLLKLESNSSNQISSLKITNKSFSDYSKLINNLCKNVDEVKKKKISKDKEKERKAQAFKRGRKMITEINFNNRSKTLESHLNHFKNKIINIDGKKNISKINKKPDIIGHKQGNKTMSSFRNINEIEKEQEISNLKSQRFKNISFQNTSQNFRKGNHKNIPATPAIKLKEREKNQLIAKTLNSKKIDYKNQRNNHSRTVILSHLTDIDEKGEQIEKNNHNYNTKLKNNKNVKRIIYKNENKNKVIKINYKEEKDNEKKIKAYKDQNIQENLNKSSKIKTSDDIINNLNINDRINTSIHSNKNININIQETNELKNIVKLVDDVNENLKNLLLKENKNEKKRKSSVKDIMVKTQSTNALISAIKDVKIKELQNNSQEISEYFSNNSKHINKDKETKEKKNIIKSYSLNYSQMMENVINFKKNENNKSELFKKLYNNIQKIKYEEHKKSIIKKNKSFNELGHYYHLFDCSNDKKYSKSNKNLLEISNTTKEIKNNLIKKENIISSNNNNNKNEKIQIINSIIDIILDKTKEKIEIINNEKLKQNILSDNQEKESNKNGINNSTNDKNN
jgi:hypothetical protein